ncbi:MAG: phospholipase D family protein [bacterium]|nr:phospholipase D family protein [bacterium]
MYFLTGVDIQTQVRTIASRSGKVMVAVAYWGKGAAERTGLSGHEDPASVRIICDLLSGACNPNEIKALQQCGFRVRTLDRLHAKVWIGGDDVIVGSANASQNGLLGEGEKAADANVEAAVISHDPAMARRLAAWFELQWDASTEIERRHLVRAWQIWKRHRRSGGRGFTSTLGEKIRNPGPLDRFSALRLIAYPYPDEGVNPEAIEHVHENARRYYTAEEWDEFGAEHPWYEWPIGVPVWSHRPGTVFADFDCPVEGGQFRFNGFWQIRDCPIIELEETRITLLTKLPDLDGYPFPRPEQTALARSIRAHVEERGCKTDKFGSYIDQNFLEFFDPERPALHRRLVTQVAEAARELCRAGRFGPKIILHAIQACTRDPEWRAAYARFVGGDIYRTDNKLKEPINREFGRSVRAATRAHVQTDERGRTIRETVEGEIIQSYTLLKK